MTIGIYKLEFEDGSYYIGKSVNIEDRYNGHLSSLKRNKHHNILVQTKYNKYGKPKLLILKSTLVKELTATEEYYIANNINNNLNLNISIGGINENTGIDHGNSKYTYDQIEEVFLYLVNRYSLHSDISKATGVPLGTIKAISCGKRHTWLKDIYPDQYNLLLNTKTEQFVETRIVKDNLIITIKNGEAASIARSIGIDPSNLSKLIKGKAKSCQGWRIYGN